MLKREDDGACASGVLKAEEAQGLQKFVCLVQAPEVRAFQFGVPVPPRALRQWTVKNARRRHENPSQGARGSMRSGCFAKMPPLQCLRLSGPVDPQSGCKRSGWIFAFRRKGRECDLVTGYASLWIVPALIKTGRTGRTQQNSRRALMLKAAGKGCIYTFKQRR
eukprot:s5784_g11.t1